MTLHLHIDHVVLDGADPDLRFSPSQRAGLMLSLQQALGQAFVGWRPGAWPLQPQVDRVDAGLVPHAASPAQLGGALAQALRQGLASPPPVGPRRRA